MEGEFESETALPCGYPEEALRRYLERVRATEQWRDGDRRLR